MTKTRRSRRTIVGDIDPEVLRFTVGKDLVLDRVLVHADCLGSAAHATMLSRVRTKPPVLSAAECRRVTAALKRIMRRAEQGRFQIAPEDQDVHLAVERELTKLLGDTGRRIHTARSRNDQVAVDLRIYGRAELLSLMGATAGLADRLLSLASRCVRVPMVGRTHLQPAMPSSVGVWASAHAESLLDDWRLLKAAFDYNDACPLGSAAGYGVPFPVDRNLTARLLGFREPVHNVLYASNARGKCESVILAAASQVMLSLSRLAEDMILYSMPEFGYFVLPAGYCTGSSIMPQKRNPDVLELVRAKARRVMGQSQEVMSVVAGLPGGYNRDLQETKEPFIEGLATTIASVRIMAKVVSGTKVDQRALKAGFTPDVFATDRALELVKQGVPFRDAYRQVRGDLAALGSRDPLEAIAAKRHVGAPMGLDFRAYARRVRGAVRWVSGEQKRCRAVEAKLMGGRA